MQGISQSRSHDDRAREGRQVNFVEVFAVLAVIAAVLAMAIWFVFFSSGGIGPGTV